MKMESYKKLFESRTLDLVDDVYDALSPIFKDYNIPMDEQGKISVQVKNIIKKYMMEESKVVKEGFEAVQTFEDLQGQLLDVKRELHTAIETFLPDELRYWESYGLAQLSVIAGEGEYASHDRSIQDLIEKAEADEYRESVQEGRYFRGDDERGDYMYHKRKDEEMMAIDDAYAEGWEAGIRGLDPNEDAPTDDKMRDAYLRGYKDAKKHLVDTKESVEESEEGIIQEVKVSDDGQTYLVRIAGKKIPVDMEDILDAEEDHDPRANKDQIAVIFALQALADGGMYRISNDRVIDMIKKGSLDQEASEYLRYKEKEYEDEKWQRRMDRIVKSVYGDSKPKPPKGTKLLTKSEWQKMINDTAEDLVGDLLSGSDMSLDQVVQDVADSMLYDPDVKNYMTYKLEINPKWHREALADEIYDAGLKIQKDEEA